MIKVLNIVFFFGGLLQAGAKFFKNSVPAWKKVIEANKKEQYIEELNDDVKRIIEGGNK
jgi:hypothetical protein